MDYNEKSEGQGSLFMRQINGWGSRDNRDDYGNVWVPKARAW